MAVRIVGTVDSVVLTLLLLLVNLWSSPVCAQFSWVIPADEHMKKFGNPSSDSTGGGTLLEGNLHLLRSRCRCEIYRCKLSPSAAVWHCWEAINQLRAKFSLFSKLLSCLQSCRERECL